MNKLGALAIFIIFLIFITSCISKQVSETETYYETEFKTEEYTSIEQYEFSTPHSQSLFYKIQSIYLPFILLHKDQDGNVSWAELEQGRTSVVTKINLESTGKNHRISITEPLCWVTICRFRDAYASTRGFQPAYQINFPDSLFTANFPKSVWAHSPAAIAFGDPSMVEDWNKIQKDSARSAIDDLIQNGDLMSGYPGEAKRYGALPIEYGFDISKDSVDVSDVRNLPSDTKLKNIDPPYDFPFDVMFQKGDWCLLEINATQSIQIDYVWDSVEIRTGPVTRTRPVPYEVEKQRTVIQIKKVPFWEAIFH